MSEIGASRGASGASATRVRRLRSWFRNHTSLVGFGRFTLAVLGIAALVEGFIIAWHVDAATPLLVVGAILAGLGLFNWTEVQARWRDFSLSLLLAASEKINEVREREDLSPDAQEDLTEAAANVAAVAAVTASGATGPTGATGPSEPTRWVRAREIPTRAFHRYREDGGLVLGLDHAAAFGRHRCVVTQPDGEAVDARAKHPGGPAFPPPPVEVNFPDDFPSGTQPLKEGTYEVDWYVVGSFMPDTLVGKGQPRRVAHDEFDYPPSAADALILR